MPEVITPIPTQKDFARELKAIDWPKESGKKLLTAIENFHTEAHPDYFNASTLKQAIKVCKEAQSNLSPKELGKFSPLEKSVGEYEAIQKTFLLPAHMAAIDRFTRRRNYAIGIREAGEPTLERLKDGDFLPKPMAIKEKTIKESSLKDAYGSKSDEILQSIKHVADSGINIKGLVGHWENGSLVGIHVDDINAVKKKTKEELENSETVPRCQKIAKTNKTDPDQFYYPVDVSSQQALVDSLAPLNQSINKDWKKHAYTGDYDLHHILVKGGAGKPHATTSDSWNENNVIKELNCAMPGNRKGNDSSEKGVTADALFQHGPQSSYYAHYKAEEGEKKRREAEEARRNEEMQAATQTDDQGEDLGKDQDQQVQPDENIARPSYPQVHCENGQWQRIEKLQELKEAFERAGVIIKPDWEKDISRAGRKPSRGVTAPTESFLRRQENIAASRQSLPASRPVSRQPSSADMRKQFVSGADSRRSSEVGSSLSRQVSSADMKKQFVGGADSRRSSEVGGSLSRQVSSADMKKQLASGAVPRRASATDSDLPSESNPSLGSSLNPQQRASDTMVGSSSGQPQPQGPSLRGDIGAKPLPIIRTRNLSSLHSMDFPSPVPESAGPSEAQSSFARGFPSAPPRARQQKRPPLRPEWGNYGFDSNAQEPPPLPVQTDPKVSPLDVSRGRASSAGPSAQRREPVSAAPDPGPSSLVGRSTGSASRAGSSATQRRSDSQPRGNNENPTERSPEIPPRGQPRGRSRGRGGRRRDET